ncbi:MAG: histone deacetylase [Planctomycetaceae bacterium]|nr:histone deacetylase [Planctomycetaceae bacterium]MBP61420.1 histone deacetylase [Planctomycetaceae bacterium]
MTLLYYDPVFLLHDTGFHPECIERLRKISAHLKHEQLDVRCTKPACPTISADLLQKVHPVEHTRMIEQFVARGGGRIETDTIVSHGSYRAALQAAGAAADAVARVLTGQDLTALCLVRPPGHHALPDKVMGFCLLNNVAIAARVAHTEFSLERILIVDWDVHHGNGTQDIFWEDPHVAFFSIHRWPFYPGTGLTQETGSGAGLGTTLNLPTEFETSREQYLDSFQLQLEHFAKKIQPQLILISAGFDSHRQDPIGSLGLETEDFSRLTRIVLELAQSYCEGRVVSVLEGGYNTKVLAESVGVHLAEMLGQ